MSILLVAEPNKRLHFVLQALFRPLGISWQVIPRSEFRYEAVPPTTKVWSYGAEPLPGAYLLPYSGWLREGEYAFFLPRYDARGFFYTQDGIDLFAAAFYVLTEYYFWDWARYDTYGRYVGLEDFFAQPFWDEPFLQKWLYQHLIASGVTFCKPAAQKEITIDIDAPYAYRHRNLLRVAVGGLRHRDLARRYEVLLGSQKDPFDTYAQLMALFPPSTMRFFLLLPKAEKGRIHVLRLLKQRGYSVGLHPSFAASWSLDVLAKEKELLERFSDCRVTTSRQHYIRYRFPDTFRNLLQVGIEGDYSALFIRRSGFMAGLAWEYAFYDVQAEAITSLWRFPTLLMDQSLLRYQGRGLEEISEIGQRYWQLIQTYGGVWRILWHNSTPLEPLLFWHDL
ncbi:MAG: hypothetical protein ACUVRD_02370 [Bacteroidia bacterium]